jgi:hypothetical protein
MVNPLTILSEAVMTKPPTVNQYIARATSKYRRRYQKMLAPDDPYNQYSAPEYTMPRADHAFCIGPYLVSRPYRLAGEDVKDICDWASSNGLELDFDGRTTWHPATLLITAYCEEHRKDFYENAKQYGNDFYRSVVQELYYAIHGEVHAILDDRDGFETGLYVISHTRAAENGVGRTRKNAKVEDFLELQKGYVLGHGQ